MTKVKEVDYIGNLKRAILCHYKYDKDIVIFMESITKEDEENIDITDSFIRNNSKDSIIINKNNIYFYGEINFDDKNDIDVIRKHNLVDIDLQHSWIPHNFKYSTAYGELSKAPTNNPIKWFKYIHCRLGKPRRIIVYKIPKKLI